MVIKHHLFTNFSLHGIPEPTWVNVAREPVSRFISSYYFRRYGFNRHEGVRNKKVKKGERQIDMVSYKMVLTFSREGVYLAKFNLTCRHRPNLPNFPNSVHLAEIGLIHRSWPDLRNLAYLTKIAKQK